MKSKFLTSLKPMAESDSEEFVKVDPELLPEDDGLNVDSDDDLHHTNLLNDISKLDATKQKTMKWKATRFESKKDVNEFNISKSKEQLTINDLLKDVKQTGGGLKKLKHWHKKHLMDEPLEKPEADLIRRKVNYSEAKKELKKWDPIVEANRDAPQMQFPLKQETLKLKPATEVVKQFQPKTKLEMEVSELLNKSENNQTDSKALTVAEEKILKAMSLEEARIRHKELQKMRALLSYQEVKLKRQSKIKSKRYHRILKRERLKKSLQEFEDNKKTDPQIAIDKLNELDKLRALERASLKHKNTGKWAKHLKLRSKYDDSARMALTEQLQLSQKLLQRREELGSDEDIDKNKADATDSEDEDPNNESEKDTNNQFEEMPDDYNPWLRSGRKKEPNPEQPPVLVPQQSPQLIPQQSPKQTTQQTTHQTPPEVKELINLFKLSKELDVEQKSIGEEYRRLNYEINGDIAEQSAESDEEVITDVPETKEPAPIKPEPTEPEANVQIDPNDFISIKTHKIKSSFPDLVTELDSEAESGDESDGISDDEQRKLVSEAFAGDDIINDFKKDKSDQIDGEQPKDINLHLPGWGLWAGSGIRPSKRKESRFIVRANKRPRKDSKLGNVIISEKKDDIIAKYRVSSLPFPFKNTAEFEKSIRLPIGRTWNPETAFRELTEPKLVTKMGALIDPIDADAITSNSDRKRAIISRIKRKKEKQKQQTTGKLV